MYVGFMSLIEVIIIVHGFYIQQVTTSPQGVAFKMVTLKRGPEQCAATVFLVFTNLPCIVEMYGRLQKKVNVS